MASLVKFAEDIGAFIETKQSLLIVICPSTVPTQINSFKSWA